MPRLLSPDDACVQVNVPIGRGQQYTGKSIDVSDPSHIKALRQAGYTLSDIGGPPSRRGGFECTACGRRNFFRRCGKCGLDAEE